MMFRVRAIVTLLSLCGLAITFLISGQSTGKAGFPFGYRYRRPDSMEKLADKIDDLEKELNNSGTIIAKTPDVWGQARLMKHRQEYEQILAKELTTFKVKMQASLSRSDQAFFANALAIQAALNGTGSPPTSSPSVPVQVNTMVANPAVDSVTVDADGKVINTTRGVVIHRTPPGTPAKPSDHIGLEPTIELDQLSRYLNHLHELRRINEGDDTADSPGYSLNLVRVPVSILPGSKTRKGYGAEITVSAQPHISEELLATVFRQLVINDLVDQLALPITKYVNGVCKLKQEKELLEQELAILLRDREDMERIYQVYLDENKIKPAPAPPAPVVFLQQTENGKKVRVSERDWKRCKQIASRYSENGTIESVTFEILSETQMQVQGDKVVSQTIKLFAFDKAAFKKYLDECIGNIDTKIKGEGKGKEGVKKKIDELSKKIAELSIKISNGVSAKSSNTRRSRMPISASQFKDVFGGEELLKIAGEVFKNRDRSNGDNHIHLSNVRGFLREELNASYDYLLTDEYKFHWNHVDSLNELLRSNQKDRIKRHRELVIKPDGSPDEYEITTTRALAWAILVESALLNQQLNSDIKRVSQDPNCSCNDGMRHAFYMPDLTVEAKMAFTSYVQCRWPIRVFTLDPVTQDQNVSDRFSMRREMQLAMALSFASGRVNAQNMTRFVRRMELDLETVALNRTAVGFSHGDDTFGWRFYPRVQTPDIESNGKVLFRDMLWGGPNKDHLKANHKLESGMRECVAIVVMPSFVPHVTLDVRSNWFKLTKPGITKVSMKETLEMSRKVRSLQDAMACCVKDQYKYRYGEVQRLYRRVAQLDKKLPLQTMHAQVPYENTLGGFEMFSSGITDLAPELIDFYGMPGINPTEETVLYLVGDNFSVQNTSVLAGNKTIPFKLLSRQVMEVTIPAGVRQIEKKDGEENAPKEYYVDLHLATPYGVTNHLHIPVDNSNNAGITPVPVSFKFAPTQDELFYYWKEAKGTPVGMPPVIPLTYDIASIQRGKLKYVIKAPQNVSLPAEADSAEFQFKDTIGVPLKGAVTTETSPILPIPAAPAVTLGKLKYSEKEKGYLIEGTEFTKLHLALLKAVKAHLRAQTAAGKNPFISTPIRVTATASIKLAGIEKIEKIDKLIVFTINLKDIDNP